MYDVFISYVHGQKIAKTMKEALEKRGLNVFVDTSLSMGDSLVMSINRAMKESKSYLLIIDNAFINGEWTKAEALKSKKLFPLLVDDNAKEFWIKENPLFANFLGRTWEGADSESLAEEMLSVLNI